MQAEHIGSHFSHNGPINFISRPDCYIYKDASVDTHIVYLLDQESSHSRHRNIVLNLLHFEQTSDVPQPLPLAVL